MATSPGGGRAGTRPDPTGVPAPRASIELAVGGMTCASCAARVQKKLNRLAGVEAAVNYATERAAVSYDPEHVTPESLIKAIESAGYTAHRPRPEGESVAGSRRRLAVAVALTVPVLVMAMVPGAQFDYWQWVSLELAVPVVFWAGWPIHRAAWRNLRHGAATMDALVSLGTLAALGWSLYALVFGTAGDPGMRMGFELTASGGSGAGSVYFEVAAGVTTFILTGRYVEARARRRSGAALRALLDLAAKDVAVLRGRREVRIPVDQLRVGDRFVVRPGEKVAADGVVVAGSGALDASLLTGESVPVEVGPGDQVTGATVNAGGRLVVRATGVGADTRLARIGRMVNEAQSGKAPVARLADRVSGVFVPLVVVAALVTLVAGLAAGVGAERAFTAAVAVLIVACPCALGLATPTALLVGTGRGAQLGMVIKGPEVLESTRRVEVVVLDKTGTVTTGRMSLRGIVPAPGVDGDDLLRLAGAVEAASEHPLGRAVAAAAENRLGALPAVDGFTAHPGRGVLGTVVEGDTSRAVVVGKPSLLADWGLPTGDALPAGLAEAVARTEEAGRTAVLVGVDGHLAGVLDVGDTPKESSVRAVADLRALGLRPMLLTGDNPRAARAAAAAVGIDADDVLAEVGPEGKVAAVAGLRAAGRVVAMVGDGVNDAAALAEADLGLAMGTGTDVAIEAGDITLVRGDPRTIADAIRLSRRTLRTIKGNLFWAFAYNVALVPVAALGLVNPLLAGAAMALSSLFVVSNSLRLRRFRPSAD